MRTVAKSRGRIPQLLRSATLLCIDLERMRSRRAVQCKIQHAVEHAVQHTTCTSTCSATCTASYNMHCIIQHASYNMQCNMQHAVQHTTRSVHSAKPKEAETRSRLASLLTVAVSPMVTQGCVVGYPSIRPFVGLLVYCCSLHGLVWQVTVQPKPAQPDGRESAPL